VDGRHLPARPISSAGRACPRPLPQESTLFTGDLDRRPATYQELMGDHAVQLDRRSVERAETIGWSDEG
jgi:hypothetical protein